jgi:hypothetical protein
MQDFEKLGEFYLGKLVDPETGKLTDEMLLYDSPDLTTHAVCIGMTGSGKTGLCISLLEEAAIDGIPAIIIDPKGDMTNLALTFPEFSASDFEPWINPDEARKKQVSISQFAQETADAWKKGLENWGQSSERIRRFKNSADVRIYTPGSTAGIPLSIIKSFDAPSSEILEDSDLLNERISSTVTGLLGLLGIDADPIQSREHILVSNILQMIWQQGQSMDMAGLIRAIQVPPISKIGVFDLESFYPARDRNTLAMALNNLLAAPTFQTWLEGQNLDVQQILYNENGKPQLSVMYIAHLSDAERLFFVTLLLNQILSWMRRQSGTTSLRALLYFDEIFGYMPPVANPPTKKLMLTLLKQARAFGVGLVLATQNPVDLDYKGLSNIGTWLIGRLQTDRDRQRVLDGLSESGELSLKTLEKIISGLNKRIFLLHNVHEKEPAVFHTRWAMSFLAGPLTRNQIKTLKGFRKETHAAPPSPMPPLAPGSRTAMEMPVFPPSITPLFAPLRPLPSTGSEVKYQPFVWGNASLRFSSHGIDSTREIRVVVPFQDAPIDVDWETARPVDFQEQDLSKSPVQNAVFLELPDSALKEKNYIRWERDFTDYLYRTQVITLWKSPVFQTTSHPGESERDFRIRLSQIAREKRDAWTETIRKKYATRISSLERRIRTAEDRLIREKEQAKHQKLETAVHIGTTLLGAFLGGKITSRSNLGRASTAARSASRAQRQSADVGIAEENIDELKQELQELQTRFQEDVRAGKERFDVLQESLESTDLRPKKSDISVRLVNFIWMPV